MDAPPVTPLALAALCSKAYDGGTGFTDVKDLRFGVFDFPELCVVVFRGSANAFNWLRDLEALPKQSRSGDLAHHGFVDSADALWVPVLRSLYRKGKPVIFTGHSLGGAIAVIFAAALSFRAVTFGCPRVWWALRDPPVFDHIRIVCDDDPVPGLPLLSFRHDDSDAVLELSDGDGEWINPEDHFITHYLERLACRSSISPTAPQPSPPAPVPP